MYVLPVFDVYCSISFNMRFLYSKCRYFVLLEVVYQHLLFCCRCKNSLTVKRSDLLIHSLFRLYFVSVELLSVLVSLSLKDRDALPISLLPAVV